MGKNDNIIDFCPSKLLQIFRTGLSYLLQVVMHILKEMSSSIYSGTHLIIMATFLFLLVQIPCHFLIETPVRPSHLVNTELEFYILMNWL